MQLLSVGLPTFSVWRSQELWPVNSMFNNRLMEERRAQTYIFVHKRVQTEVKMGKVDEMLIFRATQKFCMADHVTTGFNKSFHY